MKSHTWIHWAHSNTSLLSSLCTACKLFVSSKMPHSRWTTPLKNLKKERGKTPNDKKKKTPESPNQFHLLAQLLPKPLREKPAGIHAQIHGGGQSYESRRILRAVHVWHANLNLRLAASPLTLHARRHHKTSIHTVRPEPVSIVPAAPRAARRRCRTSRRGTAIRSAVVSAATTHINDKLSSFGSAQCGLCEHYAGGTHAAVGVRYELEAVAEAVGAAALAPRLEPPPGLPCTVARAKNEPRTGIGAAHTVRTGRSNKRRDHGSCRNRRTGKVMNRNGPSLALLPRTLTLTSERTQPASRTSRLWL